MNGNKQFLQNQLTNKYFKSSLKANLPVKYWDSKLSDFEVLGSKDIKKINSDSYNRIVKYISNLKENIEKGKGLYIWGPARVGKSLVATIILKKIGQECVNINKEIAKLNLDNEYMNDVYFVQATALYRYYFRNTCSQTELEIARNLPEKRAIVIDDIGKLEYAPGDLKVFMFDDLIRYRQLNGLITIFTSNTPLEGMKELLNESIYEIIKETCEEITLVGEPYHS